MVKTAEKRIVFFSDQRLAECCYSVEILFFLPPKKVKNQFNTHHIFLVTVTLFINKYKD